MELLSLLQCTPARGTAIHLGAKEGHPSPAPLMLQQGCAEPRVTWGTWEVWEHAWAQPAALQVGMLQPSHWEQTRDRLVLAW